MSNEEKILVLRQELKDIEISLSEHKEEIYEIEKVMKPFNNRKEEIWRQIRDLCPHLDGEYTDDFQSFGNEVYLCCISCHDWVRTVNPITGQTIYSNTKDN